jgi:hypothetical protein
MNENDYKSKAHQIKNEIDLSTYDNIVDMVENLYVEWLENEEENILSCLEKAVKNFGFEGINNLQIGLFRKAKDVLVYKINYIEYYLSIEENKDEDNEEKLESIKELKNKLNKILSVVIDADNAIQFTLLLKSTMTSNHIELTRKQEIFKHEEIDYSDLSDYQTLLIYLFEQLKLKGYKRYIIEDKGYCYEQIYTKNGYNTCSWKEACSINKFIYEMTSKSANQKMWKLRTKASISVEKLEKELTESSLTIEFDDLSKNRHVFSFLNGIYVTNVWDEEGEKWVDEWIPYGENKKIGDNIVSSKLFNMEFEDCSDMEWFEIIKQRCPNMRHIMNYQTWPEEAQRWFCILVGRLFYDIKELGEDWQVIPFLLGQAGTGKSTLLDGLVGNFYDREDIGTLSNNVEKKFGLSAFVDKKMFIASEIKKDLCLDQAEFQTLISGEYGQVNIKHKTAKSKQLKTPGILAGNEIPNWSDNSNSMSRRIVMFPFNVIVKKNEGDSKLGEKLRKEIPYVMQACNRGYLEAIDKYKGKGIWDILPEFFRETKEQISQDTNALVNFLNSDKVTISPELVCPEKIFVNAFNDHCREHSLGTFKWCVTYFRGPFENKQISLKRNQLVSYNGKKCSGSFIFGVNVLEGAGAKI